MSERRRHPRLSLEVDVDVSTAHNFYAGKTRDISMGGLFIETPVGLEPGTEVTVSLALGQQRFTLTCKVAWILGGASGTAGFGVEFDSIPEKAKKAIHAFMKKRAPMDFDMAEPELDEADETPAPAPPRKGPPPLPPLG
ncbi:MAG: PilZ domain-containing protein [Polyangiaceae bacterium]|nr:PilZ domain-containing protein [Polyangiaceae bacterium]